MYQNIKLFRLRCFQFDVLNMAKVVSSTIHFILWWPHSQTSRFTQTATKSRVNEGYPKIISVLVNSIAHNKNTHAKCLLLSWIKSGFWQKILRRNTSEGCEATPLWGFSSKNSESPLGVQLLGQKHQREMAFKHLPSKGCWWVELYLGILTLDRNHPNFKALNNLDKNTGRHHRLPSLKLPSIQPTTLHANEMHFDVSQSPYSLTTEFSRL